ncbi:SAE2-domain-containing protein [Dothidotthia symphoricarpi CBS 119687]|uniref:SAE2-domain-containing protein n=1 Tax=Dothidotthia symphoricarpi CBS 119687 TaxID=1392245 RepID=A0A6A6ADY4_9PLEO|nr:SAE2-domain-containing protein [Dothidotthia symphoricarpi CBS 119687]KAF2129107.1 SAE2-domain-containing protein [Dothidotthia symphoricarpi CBS 119687]
MSDFSQWIENNKALWTRVYDEVIAPDLEKEWKQREDKHTEELKNKDENQRVLYRCIKEEADKNDRLIAENEELKKQLQEPTDIVAPTSDPEGVDIENSTVSAEEFRRVADELNDLQKKYREVALRAKYLERKNKDVLHKNKEMKASVHAWKDYIDREAEKQKLKSEARTEGGQLQKLLSAPPEDARPCIPSSPGSVSTVRTPRFLADMERPSPGPIAPLALQGTTTTSATTPNQADDRSSNASLTPKPLGRSGSVEQPNTDGDYLPSVHFPQAVFTGRDNELRLQARSYAGVPGSSQTTVDENVEQIRLPQVPETEDDDMPEFVSGRSLKRKRGPSSKFEVFADHSSDGTPVKPFRVKQEVLSSPPSKAHTLSRKETVDLDEPAPIILRTPRHPRRSLESNSNTTGTLRHQRSTSLPASQAIKPERDDDSRDAEGHAAVVGDESGLSHLTAAEQRALSEPSGPFPGEILAPIDSNIPGNTPEQSSAKRLRRAETRHQEKHRMLTESGETPPPMDDNEKQLGPRLARIQFNRRLQAAKEANSPAKNILQTPKAGPVKIKVEQTLTPPSSASRSTTTLSGDRTTPSNPRPNPRDISTPIDRPIWTLKASETGSGSRTGRASPPEKTSPLRRKKVTELKVHDFKPNPAYNQGYSYAFSETVRKRGDRMCLPGCTNPSCCGSTFRALAAAQARLPPSQEEALLEEYLGDAYNTMNMTQMASDERAELILQARTKKMAKDTGKHREAYERRRTPPGFWRVDFPTTQEQQEDRERAKEQEKGVVQERWLEAQRKGGKWIFRDE